MKFCVLTVFAILIGQSAVADITHKVHRSNVPAVGCEETQPMKACWVFGYSFHHDGTVQYLTDPANGKFVADGVNAEIAVGLDIYNSKAVLKYIKDNYGKNYAM